MKKLLVVLLSLGLIVAFSAPASATVVAKFGGAYYVAGVYDNNPSLKDSHNYSMAMFHQRLRLGTEFQVAEGLKFSMRFDALEKNWGDTRWKGGFTDATSSRASTGAAGTKVQENIEMELAWVTFNTAIGQFDVGYQNRNAWGTDFANSTESIPTIQYATKVGPMTVAVFYEKLYEAALLGQVAHDDDNYGIFGVYKAKGMEAGLLYKYYVKNNAAATVKTKMSLISPYMKATFGPVYMEAEVDYLFGKYAEMQAGGTDVDADSLGAYLKGQFNMGPAYVGLELAYVSGNDPDDATKKKNIVEDGTGWGPAIILGGSDRVDWLDGTGIGDTVVVKNKMDNVMWYSLYGGYKVTPKLLLQANLTMATTVKKQKVAGVEYLSDKYGTEFDVRATYKIFDNLTYYVGAGYLWTGDYFKRTDASKVLGNDYVVLNKLQLSF